MYIKQLHLKNYRNYLEKIIEFSPGINFILGNNAVGKTNILEAVYLLENGRSFRSIKNTDLIMWNKEFLDVGAQLQRKDREIVLNTVIQKNNERTIKINGVYYKRVPKKQDIAVTVLFTPDNLKIIKENPEHRRAYLDEILDKVIPGYSYWRLKYQKILRQRNTLLKNIASGSMKKDVLNYWDPQMVEAGIKIISKRAKLVDKMNPLINQTYNKISGNRQSVEITYENNLFSSANELAIKFQEMLIKRRGDEIARGQTLVGPHRDDLGIFVNGIDLRAFGSQGEQRSAALALKLAELSIITEMIRETPILLLDDVMSELDDIRRTALINIIRDEVQAIITSTNEKYEQIKDELNARIIRIE